MRPARFAALIDYGRSKVYEMIARGEIRAIRLSGSWRIPASEIERFQKMVGRAE
jgi:excisionase family DNA binding protein